MKNMRAGLSLAAAPVEEILDLTFIPGQNLLVFSFPKKKKTIPGAAERGD